MQLVPASSSRRLGCTEDEEALRFAFFPETGGRSGSAEGGGDKTRERRQTARTGAGDRMTATGGMLDGCSSGTGTGEEWKEEEEGRRGVGAWLVGRGGGEGERLVRKYRAGIDHDMAAVGERREAIETRGNR